MTAPTNKGPQVSGANMFYEQQHANGDRTVTFGVDTIPVQVTTPQGKTTVDVSRADMKANDEFLIQVGQKPVQPIKKQAVSILKKLSHKKELILEFKKELESLKNGLRHGESMKQLERRKGSNEALKMREGIKFNFNKELYRQWIESIQKQSIKTSK